MELYKIKVIRYLKQGKLAYTAVLDYPGTSNKAIPVLVQSESLTSAMTMAMDRVKIEDSRFIEANITVFGYLLDRIDAAGDNRDEIEALSKIFMDLLNIMRGQCDN